MKKIGILTYLREYSNLGTNMQAYCTLRAIERAFPDARVELIDYASWRPVMRPYLSSVSTRSLKNDYRRIAKYREFFRTQLVFSARRLVSTNVERALSFIRGGAYDAIYVGSDTVLELRNARRDELTAFWLHKSIASRKALIAASSHSLTYDALSKSQKEQMRATMDDFALLGVRDEATRRLLSNVVGEGDERLRVVPDPTFTFEIDYGPADRYVEENGIVGDRPLVCLHLLRGLTWAPALAAAFRTAGYRVASLRPAHYADVVLTDLSPFEQMGIYRRFALVITHRFHDAVFCFKNKTPVIVFPEYDEDVTSFGESKMHTLFRSFGVDTPAPVAKRSLSADYLFGIHREVMATFAEKTNHIGGVLRRRRLEYEAFVEESRSRVA